MRRLANIVRRPRVSSTSSNNQPNDQDLRQSLSSTAPERGHSRQSYFEYDPYIIAELPAATPTQPLPELSAYPERISASERQTWLRDTRSSSPRVRTFVFSGGQVPPPSEVDGFLAPTVAYVGQLRGRRSSRSNDIDAELLSCVKEAETGDDYVLAVLASSTYLSVPVASRELQSLVDLDPAVYLRCLIVTIAARTDLVNDAEKGTARAMHDLSVGLDRGTTLTTVETFLHFFTYYYSSTLLSNEFILAWLRKYGTCFSICTEAVGYWERQQLHSAYRGVRCVQTLVSIFGETEVLGNLEDHSRSTWRALLCWIPKLDRLSQWEFGCLSSEQQRKLSGLLVLDGPDTATAQQPSLGMSEPACYEFVHVETRTTAHLEQMLDFLSRAEKIGPNAVELFIRFFIDNPVGNSTFGDFTQVFGHLSSDDAKFQQCLDALQPRNNDNADVCSQIMCLTENLHVLSVIHIPSLTGNLVTRAQELMSAAQNEFVAQLDIGPADYIGICILDFGKVIVEATHLHEQLPLRFLQMIRHFPERDIANAIFQRLEDSVVEASGRFSALKSHLISRLGGRSGYAGGSVDVSDIQNEANFWKTCQDPDRRELARVLSSFRCLDYKAYTTCLVAIIREKSLFVKELRVELIEGSGTRACANLITYLAGRRRQGQLLANCWTLLLVAFIEDRGSAMFVQGGSHLKSMDEWIGFVQGLLQIAGPAVVQSELVRSHGDGITQQRLAWWQTLAGHSAALKHIKALVRNFEDVGWMYLTRDEAAVRSLLQHAQMGAAMSTNIRLVISLLDPNGANLVQIVEILNSLGRLSHHGKEIIETALWRAASIAGSSSSWTKTALAASMRTWLGSALPTPADKDVLTGIAVQLDFQPSVSRRSEEQLLRLLNFHYVEIMERARKLETKRWKLKNTDAQKHTALLQTASIRDVLGKMSGADIPSELVDAIEEFAPNEFELSFPLTGLNELQRQARGVPNGARLLVVRVCLKGRIGFCVHCSPNDEPADGKHKYCRTSSREPDGKLCTSTPSLFGYYLSRNLYRLLKTSPKIATVHSSIEQWVTKPPATCKVCGVAMGVKLWKASSCSRTCSLSLRRAPLEIRLHNLLIDPLSLDLLLASIYAASLDTSGLELLPGCPVAKASLPAVINSLPRMATLAQAADLGLALSAHSLGRDQERLLSWLCLSFRGFMRTAPPGYVIPSMPASQQFLVLNSHREREIAFEKHLGTSGAGSGPVFHGTDIRRLFLIMSTGIKNVSNQPFMANGAAAGPGIYCGDEQQTSWGFARSLGQTWANSTLNSQMRLMLGCELAKYPAVNTPTHVVQDETRVLVRYVLLLPPNYRPPPRRHVAPAMSTAFAMLRSGRSS